MGQYIQKIFSGTSNRELTAKIAEQANLEVGDIVIERFSDGEMWAKYNENLRGNDIYIVQSTNSPGDNIIELALLIDAAKRASAEKINVVIPYFGYSRQDRKDEPRVPISAKVMMDIFTQAGADRIITMDLHSTQMQGFTSIPVDNLYGSLVLMEELEAYFNKIKNDNKCVVLSPDIGSNKLSQAYAKKLGIGFALIDKRRNAHNQSRVRDFAQVKKIKTINIDSAKSSLESIGIDENGLEEMDRKILKNLILNFNGGPTGGKSLAISVNEDVQTIEDVYEPYLIKEGFIERTSRGRKATDKAYKLFGISKQK